MTKKLILWLFLFFFWFINVYWLDCSYNWVWDLDSNIIERCIDGSNLLMKNDMKITGWFKEKIQSWIETIAGILWLFAVWAIAFWWFMLVISTWEEDKLKKWKDILKWWIIWFLWVVSAWVFIRIIIWILVN